MYNKTDQQAVIDLLKKIDAKLDKLTNQPVKLNNDNLAEIAKEIAPAVNNQAAKAPAAESDKTVWNLTQIQYELSNELFSGVQRLKHLIKEGERHTIAAKGKYQK